MSDLRSTQINLILPTLGIGGAELCAIRLANYWHSIGLSVTIITITEIGAGAARLNSQIPVTSLFSKRLFLCIPYLIRLFSASASSINLVFMWPLTSLAVCAWIFSGKRCKLYLTERTCLSVHISNDLHMPICTASLILMFTHRFASGVIAVSHGVANDLSRLARLNKNKISVIYNPVDLPKAPSCAAVTSSSIIRNPWPFMTKYRILSVGSLKPSKNYSLLLKAFEDVNNLLDASLVIIGEGPEMGKLKSRIFQANLQQSIALLGSRDDLSSWYASASLFVLTSNLEGFPNVIVEAMSFGVPVVSTIALMVLRK